jgi:hypothetical protein
VSDISFSSNELANDAACGRIWIIFARDEPARRLGQAAPEHLLELLDGERFRSLAQAETGDRFAARGAGGSIRSGAMAL